MMDFEFNSQSLFSSQVSVGSSIESSQKYGALRDTALQLKHARSEQKKIIDAIKSSDKSSSSLDLIKTDLTCITSVLNDVNKELMLQKKNMKEEHSKLTLRGATADVGKNLLKTAHQILEQQKVLVVLYKVQKQIAGKIKFFEEQKFEPEEIIDSQMFTTKKVSDKKNNKLDPEERIDLTQFPLSSQSETRKNNPKKVNSSHIILPGLESMKQFSENTHATNKNPKIVNSQISLKNKLAEKKNTSVKIMDSIPPFKNKKSFEKNHLLQNSVDFQTSLPGINSRSPEDKRQFLGKHNSLRNSFDFQSSLPGSISTISPNFAFTKAESPIVPFNKGVSLKEDSFQQKEQIPALAPIKNLVNTIPIQFNDEDDDDIPDTQKTQSLIQSLLSGFKQKTKEASPKRKSFDSVGISSNSSLFATLNTTEEMVPSNSTEQTVPSNGVKTVPSFVTKKIVPTNFKEKTASSNEVKTVPPFVTKRIVPLNTKKNVTSISAEQIVPSMAKKEIVPLTTKIVPSFTTKKIVPANSMINTVPSRTEKIASANTIEKTAPSNATEKIVPTNTADTVPSKKEKIVVSSNVTEKKVPLDTVKIVSSNATEKIVPTNTTEKFGNSTFTSLCTPKTIIPYSMNEFVRSRELFPDNFWDVPGFGNIKLDKAFLQKVGFD